MASLKSDATRRLPCLKDFEAPEGLEPVAVFDDFAEAGDSGLAILAMGNAYWTIEYEGHYVICVSRAKADAVRRELRELAELTQTRRARRRRLYEEFEFGWISFLLYAGILIGFFVWQQLSGIEALGRGDARAMVGSHEWWRAVTALTLHSDLVHLVSNLIAGLGFAFFVVRFFGSASGWLLMLVSGITGNILNAVVYYPEEHYSIGASTSVFGALGLLTGVGLWAAWVEPDQRLVLPRWLVPLFGGLTLLGLLGMGDIRVDVAAHISGFLCGGLLGLLGAAYQRAFVVLSRIPKTVAALSLLVLASAWGWAFLAS